jgi:hypothetical protein
LARENKNSDGIVVYTQCDETKALLKGIVRIEFRIIGF